MRSAKIIAGMKRRLWLAFLPVAGVALVSLLGCGSNSDAKANAANAEDSRPAPLVQRPEARDQNAYDGGTGFVVPFRPECPDNSVRNGAQPPDGFREWCESSGHDAGTKHDWYAEWFPDGRPSDG